MSGIEFVPAAVFAALAVRSAVYWHRHRVRGRDATDDLLFAAFVTGRVGTWLVAAGLFALFGSIRSAGRAFTDEARGYTWLVIVFLALAGMQLIAAWFLSARGAGEDPEDPTALVDPRTPEAGDEPRPPVD